MITLSQFAVNCNNKLKLFLDRWNLENISELSLEQYSQVGNNDTFSYWFEYGSEELGRISGQTSSTKYGIWNRSDDSVGVSKLYTNDGNYKWAVKYGAAPLPAFENIRIYLNQVVECSLAGDFDMIEHIDLHSFLKWKLAFIFSGKKLLPIYDSSVLRNIARHFEYADYAKASLVDLHRYIMGFKGAGEDTFDFAIKYYDLIKAKTERNYYIIGSKYKDGNSGDTVSVFPDMIEKGAISTGFFWGHDFSELVGKEHSVIEQAIRKKIASNSPEFASSLRTFKYLLNLKKGDIIAVKSHGRFNSLTIIGYAEVKEVDGRIYQPFDDDLGHLIHVDFLETHISIKPELTYAETIHRIIPGEREGHFEAIFGNYAINWEDGELLEDEPYLEEEDPHSSADELGPSDIRDKDVSGFERTIAGRTQLVQQIHNKIQNAYAKYLTVAYPTDEIKTERSRIDIWRKNADGFYIYEVKPYNTAYACIRDALGQLTDYAFSKASSRQTYLVVVGTAVPTKREISYIKFLSDNLGLKFSYDCFSHSTNSAKSYPL